jgi:hypothetical protein
MKFKFWYNNNYLHGVFVIVGTKPNWFNPKAVIRQCLHLQKDMPRGIDLAFLTNQVVNLIHGDCTNEQFAAWFIHLSNIKPKILVALDSENEVHVNQH